MKFNLNKKYQNYLFILFTAIAFFVCYYKASHFSMTNDEEFYISEGIRILNGHKLFVDNWNMTQMNTGIFNFPFIYFYKMINGNLDGIIYYIRIVYLFILVFTSIIFYLRFNKYGVYSIFASFIIIIFSPLSIKTISYHSIPTVFLILSYCFYDFEILNENLRLFISGIFFSFAVQCVPSFVLLFPIYLFVEKKRNKKMIPFLLGILFVVVLFYIIFFSNTKIEEIISNFKYIFDSSHETSPIMNLVYCAARFVVEFYPYLIVCVLTYFVYRKKYFSNLFVLSIASTIFGVLYILLHGYQSSISGWDIILIPCFIFSVFVYFLTDKESRNRKLLFGLIISFAQALALGSLSNGGLRIFAAPLIISTSLSFLLIKDYLDNEHDKFSVIVSYVYIVFILVVLVFNTYSYNLGNYKNSQLNTMYERGPLKYTYSTNELVESTNVKMDTIKNFVQNNNGLFDYTCYLMWNSWPYYCTDSDFLTMTTYNYQYWTRDVYLSKLKSFLNNHKNVRILYIYDIDNDYDISINDLEKFLKIKKVDESNGMVCCIIDN